MQRIQALVGIGRGLKYLHSMTPPMIHRDVKPQNVLITAREISPTQDMITVVKVADFGTVREDVRQRKFKKGSGLEGDGDNNDSTDVDTNVGTSTAPAAAVATHAVTRNIVGTLPYMPVEYFQYGFVNDKTDAYALGVIVLEMITEMKRKPARMYQPPPAPLLPQTVESVSLLPLFRIAMLLLCCLF